MAGSASLIEHEDSASEDVPKWKLARRGIQLLINNKASEADALFKKYPNSIQMCAGYAFAVFMDALMTFEDDKLTVAFATLKETERRCVTDSGWLKSMKSKMFGSDSCISPAEQLENQIILADTQVCMAILTFLQQDLSGYFKGSWVLRKSWKVYQHTYNEIRNIYRDVVGELPDFAAFKPFSHQTLDDEEMGAASDSSCEWEFPENPSFSNTSPSNGYIQKHPHPPKMSHSYTTNINNKPNFYTQNSNLKCNCKRSPSASNNNLSSSDNDCNFKCDTAQKSSQSRCNCVYESFNNVHTENCSTNGTGPSLSNENSAHSPSSKNSYANVNKVNLFLKKSTSANSALSKHCEKSGQSNGVSWQLPSPFGNNLSFSYFSSTFNIFSSEKQKPQDIDKETIARLMGAVSFGYGLFHLGISLLPPSLLRVTNFLGFGGNRPLGIANLMYARQGTDMRAPLATLALLWYHTIVRPFYALDGSNVQAGVEAATQLLEESQEEYRDSALFLFFKGRVCRLNSDIPSALKAFQASVDNSTQREIKILSLHEVGWCHLIQLDYTSAENTFHLLKLSSRWSRSFYAYLEIICSGSCSNIKDFTDLKELKALFENGSRGSQLELFLMRRFKCCPETEDHLKSIDKTFWRLFVYELLYLWNTLPSCSTEGIRSIIADCGAINEKALSEPMLGLSKLIQGSCFCILKQYENGISSFRKCLEVRKDKAYNAEDAHVSAFSQYELGVLLLKTPETKEEGRQLLNHTSRYKDYDFEQRLTHRCDDGKKEWHEWSYAEDYTSFETFGMQYGHDFQVSQQCEN